MSDEILIDRLAAHRTIGTSPREELEWLVAHGRLRQLKVGDVLSARSAGHVEGLFILLSGHLAMYVDRANGREKVIDWYAGDVTGMLPYSRLVAPPGDSVAEQASDVFMIHRDDLQALTRDCHCLTTTLVHVMIDRARHFTSNDLQVEKMVSLGKLSAGLAHELNNPASAIARSAKLLREAMLKTEDTSRAIGALRLDDDTLMQIDMLRWQCLNEPVQQVASPLEQADRENDFSDWLTEHGADPNDAEALAETSLGIPILDGLSGVLSGPSLGVVVRWLAAGCLTRHLADEIVNAAGRISGLVDAVKGFTHMDQSATVGPIDVVAGLSQTLAILKAKARGKSVSITVNAPPDLPRAQGIAGEVNQVWANLIDNALDAVPQSGTVTVTATAEPASVVVRVIDNGSGISPDHVRRIFDPFFTTKKVGQGTGLGLDIVKRIVQKHHGTIGVESQPGRTVFTVTLPIAPAGA